MLSEIMKDKLHYFSTWGSKKPNILAPDLKKFSGAGYACELSEMFELWV